MRRSMNALMLLAVTLTALASTPGPARAQEYNQCWSTCHIGAMHVMEHNGLAIATEWFHGCINEFCTSLAPI